MYNPFLSIIITMLLMSGCSGGTPVTTGIATSNHNTGLTPKREIPDDFIPRELHIASIGDSLTKGVGDETKQGGYTSLLEGKLLGEKDVKSVTLENFGVKGHKTSDLLKRLQNEDVQEGIAGADIIIITIGGNDIMKIVKENLFDLSLNVFQKEQEKYEVRLRKVLENIRNNNSDAEIVLVGLYNPFGWFIDLSTEINTIVDNWNEGSKNILSEFDHTKFVEVDDVFSQTSDNLLSEDEFHPNAKGYEIMSKRIFEAIMFE
ncbi:GDSL-type esterase/lipase family protein [Bacillus sp. REN16]|uniref:GDSL-type esterase/lipase family protein n=1 Tax=Bacillus sp. REN16 TaxID=2887296 RepID=UPI001E3EB494|nr:GDSL-type esterase/lipase family protein [Bacillus sp. REN16]MCC3357101.1 GDSL-type esterase/lipase family protein [Bacillus sp. REN16]